MKYRAVARECAFPHRPRLAQRILRRGFGAAAFAAVCLTIAGPSQAEDWPSKPFTIVVPASTGGSNDRAARVIAPFLAKQLGQPVVVVNKPGAGNFLGHQYFMQQKPDGYTLLRTSPSPYIAINILTQGATFKAEDFAAINMPEQDVTFIGTALEKPFKDFKSFIEAIKAKPGTISLGVQPTSTDMINFALMLKTLGLPRDSVRYVTYAGGREVRVGIAGAQFDAGAISAQGTIPLMEKIRPLVMFSDGPVEPWNAPSIVDAMKQFGEEGKFISGSIRGYLAHAAFRDKHPEQWKKLVAAFEHISKDPEAIEAHEKQELGYKWLGPEASDKLLKAEYELLSDPSIYGILKK